MAPRTLVLALLPILMGWSGCGAYKSASAEHDQMASPSNSNAVVVESDTTFSLATGESATLPTEHTVTFREIVEDSRCPRGVECVWEGRVVVALEVNGERVELSNHEQDENHRFALDDGTLVLETVNPYPDAENPSDEEPEVVLEFRRIN